MCCVVFDKVRRQWEKEVERSMRFGGEERKVVRVKTGWGGVMGRCLSVFFVLFVA